MIRHPSRSIALSGLTLLALGIFAMAQDAGGSKKKPETTPAEKIKPTGDTKKAPAKEPSEGEKKLHEIMEAFSKRREDVLKELQVAKPEDRQKLGPAITIKLNKLFAETAKQAIDLVKTLDEKDPAIPAALRYAILRDPNSTEKFEALARDSKSRTIKGNAHLILGQKLADAAEAPNLAEGTVAELQKKAASYFDIVIEKFADVPGRRGDLGKAAQIALNELRLLKIGASAPEVTCLNIDGDKQDKLSNYKGKVVVLDIWTTWCGPCVAMIPQETKMVERLKGKKFALISVSADDEKETLIKFLEKTKMPWIHWFSGNKGITEDWNVRYFPTIYIIDHKGVIRAKDLWGEKMEKKVEELLAEIEKEKAG